MQKFDLALQKLKELNIEYIENEPLKKHTTFKIGGNAKILANVSNTEALAKLVCFLNNQQIKYYILGNGSNIVFADNGFDGLVIKYINKEIQVIDDTTIIAGAGARLATVCSTACENSLTGLEFAFGIPGTIGGAIYMNAGAYGGEMKDIVQSVTYITNQGEIKTYENTQLDFGYRHSVFEQTKQFIVSTILKLQKGIKAEIQETMQQLSKKRQLMQPLDMPSAGSTFKRPEGAFAGELIERCNLKGFTVGGAQVSTKHAGFVVNIGGATCEDILNLTKQVSQIVLEKTGFLLECEIRIIE